MNDAQHNSSFQATEAVGRRLPCREYFQFHNPFHPRWNINAFSARVSLPVFFFPPSRGWENLARQVITFTKSRSDMRAEHSESRLRQPRHGLLQPLNWIKEDTRIYIQSYSFKAVYALDKEITGKEVEKQGMIRTLCRRGEETASVRGWRALPPELLGCPHCAFNAETSSSSANKPKLSHHWARKVTLACKEKL